ncbi:MAG: NAD-dependent epimerase/dehydratase family protein [bacterium]
MKILVTGATGFLGHHLIKRLIKDNCSVRILKEETASLDFLKDTVSSLEIIIGDIRNEADVEKAIAGCEVVFHLAGLISYWSKLNPLQTDINVKGTRNIANACLSRGVKKLIYVSSTVTAGTSAQGLADEQTPYNLSYLKINYCDSKFLAENEIRQAAAKGLNTAIICPGSMYGEGDIRKIKSDLTFSFKFPFNFLYISGGLGVVDVEDVVEGLIKAWQIDSRGERYILVGENLSFYEIRKIIAEELGRKPPFICLPNWFLIPLSYLFLVISLFNGKKPKLTPEMVRFNKIKFYFSNKKATQELGIKFKPFRESIRIAVKWYQENGYL